MTMENTVFTNAQFQQIYPDGIENHYWNNARNAIILRFIKRNRLQNKHMLEIGSGRGVVLKYLHYKGISCTGVEKAVIEPLIDIGDYFYAQTDALLNTSSTRNYLFKRSSGPFQMSATFWLPFLPDRSFGLTMTSLPGIINAIVCAI
jgi:hypothetical protein